MAFKARLAFHEAWRKDVSNKVIVFTDRGGELDLPLHLPLHLPLQKMGT